jgi:uncharacterized protein (DUF4415 family)
LEGYDGKHSDEQEMHNDYFKKLTPKRLKKIKNSPVVYDDDSPKLTREQVARMKPAHPEYRKVEPVKVPLSIKIDADVLAWSKEDIVE